jgi:hypothetical protein
MTSKFSATRDESFDKRTVVHPQCMVDGRPTRVDGATGKLSYSGRKYWDARTGLKVASHVKNIKPRLVVAVVGGCLVVEAAKVVPTW